MKTKKLIVNFELDDNMNTTTLSDINLDDILVMDMLVTDM